MPTEHSTQPEKPLNLHIFSIINELYLYIVAFFLFH
jgi:hypothetical protein